MTNKETLKEKQENGWQDLFKIFHYIQNKTPFIRVSIFTASNIIFSLFFNFCLGCIINIATQPNFSTKDFQINIFKSIIFLILLLISNVLNIKSKSSANTELSNILQHSIYYNSSFFDKIENSTNISTISLNHINNFSITVQNLTLIVTGIILGCLTMWKVAIPITFALASFILVSYFGNKFVSEIEAVEKKLPAETNPNVESFLSSLTSVESFNKQLYQCDHYCHVCVLLQNAFVKAPYIKDIILECLSMLMTILSVYYASYLMIKKSVVAFSNEDAMLAFIFAGIFIGNEVVHYLAVCENLKKVETSSKKVLDILEKKEEKKKM